MHNVTHIDELAVVLLGHDALGCSGLLRGRLLALLRLGFPLQPQLEGRRLHINQGPLRLTVAPSYTSRPKPSVSALDSFAALVGELQISAVRLAPARMND